MQTTRQKAKKPSQLPNRWWTVYLENRRNKKSVKKRKIVIRGDTELDARTLAYPRRHETIVKIVESKGILGWLEGKLHPLKTGELNKTLGDCASLIDGAEPLHRALQLQGRRSNSPMIRYYLEKIEKRVLGGAQLSDAVMAFPEIADSRLHALLRIAEAAGNLTTVLRKMRDEELQKDRVRSKVVAQLIYPYAIVWLAVLVFTILATKAVPTLDTMYTRYQAPLPWVSRIYFAVAAFYSAHKAWTLPCTALFLITAWIKKESLLKPAWVVRLIYKIPSLGPWVARMEFTTAVTSLAVAMKAGSSLVPAMELAGKVFRHSEMKEAWENIRLDIVNTVFSLPSDAFDAHSEAFGPMGEELVSYVRLADSNGKIDEEMERYAALLGQRSLSDADNMTEIMKPLTIGMAMTVVMCVILPVQYPMAKLTSIVMRH